MPSYGFHPDALAEYTEATNYYFERASPIVAAGFIAAVEALVQTILDSPGRWRIVDRGEIRRCLAEGYPYAIYYQWRPEENYVRIYAVMHLSRRPRYWRKRLRE